MEFGVLGHDLKLARCQPESTDMSTENTPFESFAPFTPESPPAEGAGRKRKGGRPKKAAAQADPPKAGRKKREPNPPRAGKTPRAAHLTVPDAIRAFSGLSSAEADLVGKLVIALQAAPKKSRGRIVEALGKVFG